MKKDIKCHDLEFPFDMYFKVYVMGCDFGDHEQMYFHE